MSFKQERWLQIIWKLLCLFVFKSWMISVINRVLSKGKARQTNNSGKETGRVYNTMFKYHAKEERWQNLVCTDFQLHATHFWLFVCLMCEKCCTKFIQYHSLVHRSQTQRRENVNVVVKSSEVIHRDIFLFSSLLKLKNIITKWNAATENICWAMMISCWLLLWKSLPPEWLFEGSLKYH